MKAKMQISPFSYNNGDTKCLNLTKTQHRQEYLVYDSSFSLFHLPLSFMNLDSLKMGKEKDERWG